jgi:hypothetical protein
MTNEFPEYQEMKENGIEAGVAFLFGKKNGVDDIALIRMLRQVYGLTLIQAKEVSVTADGTFVSLNEYQEKLLPALEEILRRDFKMA